VEKYCRVVVGAVRMRVAQVVSQVAVASCRGGLWILWIAKPVMCGTSRDPMDPSGVESFLLETDHAHHNLRDMCELALTCKPKWTGTPSTTITTIAIIIPTDPITIITIVAATRLRCSVLTPKVLLLIIISFAFFAD